MPGAAAVPHRPPCAVAALVALSFSGAIGLTFLMLGCALEYYGVYWPLFVLIFYFLCPIPHFIAKRVGDDSDAASSACRELAYFFTTGIVVSAFGLPIILARVEAIKWGACGLVLAGNAVIFLTILGFFLVFGRGDDFSWEQWNNLMEKEQVSSTKQDVLANHPNRICADGEFYPDWSWNMECWIRGKLDLLVCTLQLLKLDLRADLKVNLLYSGSDQSLGAASTSSLQGTVRVAPCRCGARATCECLVASPSLNRTYVLWLEVLAGATALGSPPMSLQPAEVVRPEAPVKLHLELAERGQVKLCWSSPVLLPFPLQHQVKISAPPGHGDSQMLQAALESSVALDNALLDSPSSVQVRSRNLRGPGFWSDWSSPYNLTLGDMDFNISCETDGYLTKMTCRWSANPTTSLLGSLQLRYHRSQIYCSDFPSPPPNSEVKECRLQRDHSYECTFQPIFLLSGYTLWIEFRHFLGTLESSPTCIIPADVVKPLPPSNVGAELTRNVGLLNVSWTKPAFANRDLAFQIRWNPGNRQDIPWQLSEVPSPAGSWAVVAVEQLCVEYAVQVRCRELHGAGYWSDWSRAAQTLVQDIRVDAVQSLSAYLVNSTCVVLVWSLCPQIPGIKSFVIEWKNLNKEEQMKWLRVPPDLRKYFIYDHFLLIEKYQFSLYPVFAGGVGKARATDQFDKGGFETGGSGSLHVVLPIVFFHLSFAAGSVAGFTPKPETLEHLFAKHPELTSCEPLLLGAELVLEDISVTKTSGKEEPGDFLGVDPTFPSPQDSECDSACSSSHFQSSGFSRSCQDGETTAQCDLKYATVVSNSRSSGLCRRKTNPRSCLDRCFLGEDSIALGAFSSGVWEVGDGAFLVFPGSQPSRALSLVSSEGFSEPLDEAFPAGAERSLYYLGITALEKGQREDFLTESSRGTCQLQSTDLLTQRGLLQRIPTNVKEFIQSSLKPNPTIPYVPQFRVATAKGQEATEKK
ncbi:hypothetical protein DUI87_15035 [Hirundo rustica rustica]|uniref:Leptin receptor gene-related protein n=4 Tax=Passeriformes TaxID=9126 RepID=A0A3M0KC28_HIRRU|nr:hypothetical protein DUI87_15035 [Hirundo rustica rustica]